MKTGWERTRAPGAGARVPLVFPSHRRRLKRGSDHAKQDTPDLSADAVLGLLEKLKSDQDRQRAWGGCGWTSMPIREHRAGPAPQFAWRARLPRYSRNRALRTR